ncbi:hypothetical protein GA0115241_10301, partial [Streptomyces sp. DpondAA-D4]
RGPHEGERAGPACAVRAGRGAPGATRRVLPLPEAPPSL